MSQKPEIRIDLFSRADMLAVGECLLSAIAEDLDLAPQRWGVTEPYKIPFPSEEALALWVSEAGKRSGWPGGERKRPFSIVFTGVLGFGPRHPFHLAGWNADIKALSLRDGVARIERLFHRMAIAFRAWYGFAAFSRDFERQNVHLDFVHPSGAVEEYHLEGYAPHLAIPGLYWLNYFGPEYTQFIGPDHLRALDPPVEPLGDGMLLKLADSPLDLITPDAINRTESIKRRLGADLFFDIAHPDRKTRAPFVPVPKPIDPGRLPAPIDAELPTLPDPHAFIADASRRATEWRRRHGFPIPAHPTFKEARAVLHKLEAELAPGLPDIRPEEIVADALAVLGQLIIERLGGQWDVDAQSGALRIITGRGEIVDPMQRVLKRTGDPGAHLYPWFHGLVTETLPPPLRPPRAGDGSS